MNTLPTPQILPAISDEQIARFKQVLYTLSGGDFDATDDEARQMLIAAHPHVAPAPSSVTEIVTLMIPYVAACVKFNHTPRGQMDAADAEVQTAFKPLEAVLTALVEERDRLRFELDGVNAMREVAAHQANAVAAVPDYIGMLCRSMDVVCAPMDLRLALVGLMQKEMDAQPTPPAGQQVDAS